MRTARKSATIDLELYERLQSVRRENESFSQAIKRLVKPPCDVEAFCRRNDASLGNAAVATMKDRPSSGG
jgi:predicted CopG family antitoxin